MRYVLGARGSRKAARIRKIGKENIETTGNFQKPHHTEYGVEEEFRKRVLSITFKEAKNRGAPKTTVHDLRKKLTSEKKARLTEKNCGSCYAYNLDNHF